MYRRTGLVIALVALLAASLVVGCSSGGGGGAGGPYGSAPATGGAGGSGTATSTEGRTSAATVIERSLEFVPVNLTVKVGDTVTFTNEDSVSHNVRIDGKELGEQSQGQSVTWTATKAGGYSYLCTIHPQMIGEITVK